MLMSQDSVSTEQCGAFGLVLLLSDPRVPSALFPHRLSALRERKDSLLIFPVHILVPFGAIPYTREKSPVRDSSMLYVEPQEAALSHRLSIAEAQGVHWDEFRGLSQLNALLSSSGVLPGAVTARTLSEVSLC